MREPGLMTLVRIHPDGGDALPQLRRRADYCYLTWSRPSNAIGLPVQH
jgi:hypothetical protein